MFDKYWTNHKKKNGVYVEWLCFQRWIFIFTALYSLTTTLKFYQDNNTNGYEFNSLGWFYMAMYIIITATIIVYVIGVWAWQYYAWYSIEIYFAVSLVLCFVLLIEGTDQISTVLANLSANCVLMYYYAKRKVCFDGKKGYDKPVQEDISPVAQVETNSVSNTEATTQEEVKEETKSKEVDVSSEETKDVSEEKPVQKEESVKSEKPKTHKTTKSKPIKAVSDKAKFCRYCGAELNEEASFCHKCGKKVA